MPSIFLCGSPFGPCQPVIPTANRVTLSRVASPLSIDRMYQPLFLHALKAHLDGPKRLVKPGDIVAVGVDTDIRRRMHEVGIEIDDVDPESARSPQAEYASVACCVYFMLLTMFIRSHPTSSLCTNQMVFFVITTVELDVNPSTPCVYKENLGCWLDASVTRVIQMGVDHRRIPDMGVYLGAGKVSYETPLILK